MEPAYNNTKTQIWGPLPEKERPKSADKVEQAVRAYLRHPTPESRETLTKLAIHLKQFSVDNTKIWERLTPSTQDLFHRLAPYSEPPLLSSLENNSIMKDGYILPNNNRLLRLYEKGKYLEDHYCLSVRKLLGLPTHNYLAIGAKGDWAMDAYDQITISIPSTQEQMLTDMALHFHKERLWDLTLMDKFPRLHFRILNGNRCIYKHIQKPEFSKDRTTPLQEVENKLKEWEPELKRQELKLKWLEKIGMENIENESAIIFAMLLDTIADAKLSPDQPPTIERLQIFVEILMNTHSYTKIAKHLTIKQDLKAQLYAYIFTHMPVRTSVKDQLKEFDKLTGNLLKTIAKDGFMTIFGYPFCEELEKLESTFEQALLLLQFEARHSEDLTAVNAKLETLFRSKIN